MSDNPTSVLIDISGSQVGTATNPFHITGSCTPPQVIVNNIVNITSSIGADPSAYYVLTQPIGTLTNSKTHQLLRELVHIADEDGPRGALWPSGMVKDTHNSMFPTGSVWWVDSTRTEKIAEVIITRNSYKLPVTIQWKVYSAGGLSVAESFTDTIIYNGVIETSRTRTNP